MGNNFVTVTSMIIQVISLLAIAIREKKDEISIVSGLGIIVIITIALNTTYVELETMYRQLVNKSVTIVLALIMCITLLKSRKTGEICMCVVIPIMLASLLVDMNMVVAIYLGVVSIVMIIVGFYNKNLRGIYIEGIVFLVMDIILQFWNFWGTVPTWAYLLIGGLTLIGIVTGKELKKAKENEEKK